MVGSALACAQVHAEERWCRTERMFFCDATKCGPMQDPLYRNYDFKLTWNVASGKGFRTDCISEGCSDKLTAFSLDPNQSGLVHGIDGWTMDFPASDNHFVVTQGLYIEDHGARNPLVSLVFGYCSLSPLDRRG